MEEDILKEINKLDKKERKILMREDISNKAKEKLFEKVPDGLQHTIEIAFSKAFQIIFLKGTFVIEKTFNKETLNLEYQVGDYVVDGDASRRNIKSLDKSSKKGKIINTTATTISGLGMGFIGLGIPDIPLLTATILKGIYEVATSYGFSYVTDEEKIYILRLIRTALAKRTLRLKYNDELDQMIYYKTDLENEINCTSKVLSDALLVEKFIQGIPVVGVIGGVVNYSVSRNTAELATVKYKKRYLYSKIPDSIA